MGTIIDDSEVRLELGLSASITDEERAIVSLAVTKAEGAVKRYIGYDPTLRLRTEFYPRADSHYGSSDFIMEVNDTNAYARRSVEAATAELQVQHIPIRAEAAAPIVPVVPAIDLRIDYDGRSGTQTGAFDADTLKEEGQDYWPNYETADGNGVSVCKDGIIRSFGLWPTEAGSVRIIYTAGYTDDELHGQDAILDASPIAESVLNEAKRRVEKIFIRRKRAGVGFAAGPFTSESLGDYSYSIDSALSSKLYGDMNTLMDESRQALQEFINMGWRMFS